MLLILPRLNEFNVISQRFGCTQIPMGILSKRPAPTSSQWKSVEIHGNPRKSAEIHWNPLISAPLRANPFKFKFFFNLGFAELLCPVRTCSGLLVEMFKVALETHSNPWKPAEIRSAPPKSDFIFILTFFIFIFIFGWAELHNPPQPAHGYVQGTCGNPLNSTEIRSNATHRL